MFIGFVPLSFIISLIICFLLIYLDNRAAISGDKNLRLTAQTLHKKSVSRFGGVAIYLSTVLTIVITYFIGLKWGDSSAIWLCPPTSFRQCESAFETSSNEIT